MGRKPKNGQKENTTSIPSTSSEKEHLNVLSKYKHIYDLYVRTGEIVGLYPHIRKEITDAYRVDFPHYKYNDRCNACIEEMLNLVYRYYNKEMDIRLA